MIPLVLNLLELCISALQPVLHHVGESPLLPKSLERYEGNRVAIY